jgi:hypothetical protein
LQTEAAESEDGQQAEADGQHGEGGLDQGKGLIATTEWSQ